MSPEDVRSVFMQLSILAAEMQMIKAWLASLTGVMISLGLGAVVASVYRNGKGKP